MGSDPKRGWGGVRGVRETSCMVSPPPPPSFHSLGPFSPRRLLPASAGSPGQNRGALGEVVMPGVWEVTLGEAGGRDAGNAVNRPHPHPQGSTRSWKVGALEPGGLGPVGLPGRRDPDPPTKHTLPPRPVQQRPFWSLHLLALEGPALFPGGKL